MKRFLIFLLSCMLCFNHTMVLYAEEEPQIENIEQIETNEENLSETSEIVEDNEGEVTDIVEEETTNEEVAEPQGQLEIENINEEEPLEQEEAQEQESLEIEKTQVEEQELLTAPTTKSVPVDLLVSNIYYYRFFAGLGAYLKDFDVNELSLKINTQDTDYLNAITEIRFYGCRNETEENKNDYIDNTFTISKASQKRRLYYNFSLYSDSFDVEDSRIEINYEDIIDYFENEYEYKILSDYFLVKIIASGYNSYVQSGNGNQINGPMISFDDLTFTENNNGDFVISFSSSGTDGIYDDILTTLKNSGKEIVAPDATTRINSSYISFEDHVNGVVVNTKDINSDYFDLDLTNHKLTIPASVLKLLSIDNGEEYWIELYVHGYQSFIGTYQHYYYGELKENRITFNHQPSIDENFVVSQDPKGDIYITSNNSGLLAWLDSEVSDGDDKPCISFDKGGFYNYGDLIYKKPSNVTNHNYYYEVLHDAFGNPQSILIKNEVLLADHIPTKNIKISCEYDGTEYSQNIVIKGCKNVPNDLVVEEKNGRLEISTNDKNYLQSMLKFGDETYDDVSEEKVSFEGGRILFSEGNFINNITHAGGQVTECILYDEINKVVYIDKETLLGNQIVAGDDITCFLGAYGYCSTNQTIDLSEEIASKNEDIDLSIEQDSESGDIIITCSDSDVINNLIKEKNYRPYPSFKTYEYGSQILLVDTNEKWYSFGNQRCDSADPGDNSEIKIYKVDDTHAKIPFDVVLGLGISEGTTIKKIELNIFGYKRQDVDGLSVPITKGVKESPNDVFVYENGNGDVIIQSDDLEWLQTLSKVRSNNDNNSFSRVEFQQKLGSDIYLWLYNYESGQIYYELIYDAISKTVTIPNKIILANNICNGNHELQIIAYGYEMVQKDVETINSCIECPTGVTAQLDSSGNIIIKSADTNWTNSLVTEHNDGEQSNWSHVEFQSEDGNNNFRVWLDSGIKISKDNKTVTIPQSLIYENKVPNGSYILEIYAYGYEKVRINNVIKITKGCKNIAFEWVDVVLNDDGSISIKSSVAGYIDALAKKAIHKYYDDESKNTHTEGGLVWIGNYSFGAYDSYYENKKEYSVNPFVLSKDKKSITITKEAILEATDHLSRKLINNQTYSIIINAPGFINVHKYVEINNSPINENIPNDITVSFDESIGLKISSANSDWLQGILKYQDLSSYSADKSSVILYRNDKYQEALSKDEWCGRFAFTNVEGDVSILEGSGYVYIPTSEVTAAFVNFANSESASNFGNGDYHIVINSYGYKDYNHSNPVTFELLKGAQTNEVTLSQGNNRVEIHCDDEDYLKQLARECDDKTTYYNYIKVSPDNNFDDQDNTCWVMNFSTDDKYLYYDSVNEVAYFDLDILKAWYGEYIDVDSLYFNISVLGYDDYEISSPLSIDTISECDGLVLGSAEKLSFEDHGDIMWSSDDPEIVSVDNEGVITANKLGYTRITAVGDDGVGDAIYIEVTSNKKVSFSLKLNDGSTMADVGYAGKYLEVYNVKNYTFSDADKITYTSDKPDVATVDEDGSITFNKAGVVTFTAEAIGKTASVKVSVYSVEKSRKISASFINTDGFFEVGDGVNNDEDGSVSNYYIDTYDNVGNTIDRSLLSYKSSNESIVSVNADGELTAKKAGTATITVSITGDPSSRKTTCKVTVVNRIAESIDNSALNISLTNATAVDGVITSNGVVNGVRDILIDYTKLAYYTRLNKNNKVQINLDNIAKDKLGDLFTPNKVTYQSTDTSIATVDSKGFVTFKKEGQVTITCVIASNPKGMAEVSQDIILRAINYAPKIETNKITINKYSTNDTQIKVYPIRDNSNDHTSITGCSIKENNNLDSQYFKLEKVGGTYTLMFKDGVDKQTVPAKSYNQVLVFETHGMQYSYKVTVVVASTLPTVTPKVTGNYNSFTGVNTLLLTNTVKNGTIRKIEPSTDWITINNDGTFGTPNTNAKGAYITSGKIKIYFEGYTDYGYVEKSIKLPIATTKPTVKLETGSVTVFAPEGTTQKSVSVKLIDKSKNPITSGKVELITGSLDCSIDSIKNADNKVGTDGVVKFNINNPKKGIIEFYYYEANASGENIWNGDNKIKLSLSVNVNNKYPIAKLSTSTLTLNSYYNNEDSVGISLSSLSENIKKITYTDVTGIDSVTYANGKVKVKSTTPGTYKLVLTPHMDDGSAEGYPLKTVGLTVKVNNNLPELKLKSSTITLNNRYSETIATTYTLNKNTYGTTLSDITVTPVISERDAAIIDLDDDKITFKLKDTDKALTSGLYKYTITPEFDGGYQGKPVIVTIKINNKVATAKVGAITYNPLEKDTSSLLKATLLNVVGNISKVQFANDDLAKSLFKFDTTNVLQIKSDADHSVWKNIKDQTINTKVKIWTDAIGSGDNDYVLADLSIKIARKAPTLILSATTVNVYNTTGIDAEVGRVTFNLGTGVQADIKKANITISESIAYTVEYDDTDEEIVVKLKDGAILKSSSTQTFTIKVNWDNDYYNGKSYSKVSTVKLNVKDLSYSIKSTY